LVNLSWVSDLIKIIKISELYCVKFDAGFVVSGAYFIGAD